MKIKSPQPMVMLPRATTWQQWESGRAARRALAMRITGGKILRRQSGNPRKDSWLRELNAGERGLPFLEVIKEAELTIDTTRSEGVRAK